MSYLLIQSRLQLSKGQTRSHLSFSSPAAAALFCGRPHICPRPDVPEGGTGEHPPNASILSPPRRPASLGGRMALCVGCNSESTPFLCAGDGGSVPYSYIYKIGHGCDRFYRVGQYFLKNRPYSMKKELICDDHRVFPHGAAVCPADPGSASDRQAADRPVGAHRICPDDAAQRPGLGAHAGLRHSAAGRGYPHSDAAVPVAAAEPAFPAEPAVPGGDVRHPDDPDPQRESAAGRHAEKPLHAG